MPVANESRDTTRPWRTPDNLKCEMQEREIKWRMVTYWLLLLCDSAVTVSTCCDPVLQFLLRLVRLVASLPLNWCVFCNVNNITTTSLWMWNMEYSTHLKEDHAAWARRWQTCFVAQPEWGWLSWDIWNSEWPLALFVIKSFADMELFQRDGFLSSVLRPKQQKVCCCCLFETESRGCSCHCYCVLMEMSTMQQWNLLV